MTIAEKIQKIFDTKEAIKQALIRKKVTVLDDDTFRSYADKVKSIKPGVDVSITNLRNIFYYMIAAQSWDKDGANLTYKYKGWFASNTAGNTFKQTYMGVKNITGKPLIAFCWGNTNTYVYGFGCVVSADSVKDVDYRLLDGTGSSQYWGVITYNRTTPIGHKIICYKSNYANAGFSGNDPKYYATEDSSGNTLLYNEEVPGIFCGATTQVFDRIGILADYFIFGER